MLRDGTVVAVACVFMAAALHKLNLVSGDGASSHPVIRSRAALRRRPTLSVLAATAAELAGVVLSFVAPTLGLAVLAVLLAIYTVLVRGVDGNAGCDCFGAYLPDANQAQAMRRNVALGLVTCAVLAWSVAHPSSVALTGRSLAVAVLELAPLLGYLALHAVLVTNTKERRDVGRA